jgi:hypothetical protein
MRGERYNSRRAVLRHFEVKRADPVVLHFRSWHSDFLPAEHRLCRALVCHVIHVHR